MPRDAETFYERLHAHRREIRLLTLAPGRFGDDIESTVSTVSLDDHPKYEALSYTWGDPKITRPITVNGEEFRVTTNLENALRHLRQIDVERQIWVDAVCINQDDIEERSSQVLLMQPIFETCTKGLLWLGEEDEQTARAMQFMQYLAEDVHIERPKESFEKDIKSLVWLVQRPWWSRVWTVQETILPPEKELLSGRYRLPYKTAVLAAGYLLKHKQTCCYKQYAKIEASSNEFEDRIDSLKSPASARLNLFIQMTTFRNRDASDPRDKIFAIRSLVPSVHMHLIVPDYEADVKNVYTEFVKSCIRQFDSLEILGHVIESSTSLGLPSWVVNWRLPSESLGYQERRLGRYTLYNACNGLPASASFHNLDGDQILQISGFPYDQVSTISELMNVDDAFFQTLEQWHELAMHTFSGLYYGANFEDAFWRTVQLDTIEDRSSNTSYRRAGTEHYRSLAILWSAYVNRGELQHTLPVWSTVSTATANRRLFMTRYGHLGLGPARMRVGDAIYVLGGSRCPLVIRRLNSAQHTKSSSSAKFLPQHSFVGDCYVDGIMDGEVVRNAKGHMTTVYIV